MIWLHITHQTGAGVGFGNAADTIGSHANGVMVFSCEIWATGTLDERSREQVFKV